MSKSEIIVRWSSDEKSDVTVDPTLPEGTIVIRSKSGPQLAATLAELKAFVEKAEIALEVFGKTGTGIAPELPYAKDEHQLRRQNYQLREQNKLLGERFKQQESIIRGAFARSVRGLSGNRPAAQQDAEQVVRIVEDHFHAERLLQESGVVASSVARGVRQLLDERDRVVEVPTDFPPPNEIVTVTVQEPHPDLEKPLMFTGVDLGKAEQPEVAGTYSLTNIEYNDEPQEGEKLKLGDAEATFHLGKIPALPSKP